MVQPNNASRAESSGNLFPPGLAVRHVGPTDNEAVRQLFIETQAELVPEDADLELRIAMKKYTDSSLMDDLARVSTYYREEGRRMWVLENQEREIIAFCAVDSDEDTPSEALLRRLSVRSDFRRKGVGQLLTRRAEQWAAKKGFSRLKLYVSEYQDAARDLFTKLEYAQSDQSNYEMIAVFELEKRLKSPESRP